MHNFYIELVPLAIEALVVEETAWQLVAKLVDLELPLRLGTERAVHTVEQLGDGVLHVDG